MRIRIGVLLSRSTGAVAKRRLVETRIDVVVDTVSLREAQLLGALYHDFFSRRLRLQQAHRLGDVLIEWHSLRVESVFALQRGLYLGRDDFDDLYAGIAKLETQRLRVGMQRGFARAIRWSERARQKAQCRGDVDDSRARLVEQR